jgi:mRNA interferase RelE/StbE
MYRIEFSHLAAKELEKVYNIDKKLYARFIVVIEALKTNPFQGKRLKGKLAGDYSLRLGNYRIIYTVKNERLIIYIIDLGHRSEIYK